MQAKNHQRVKAKRKAIKILGDTSRVITLLHLPADRHRISRIIQRIISMPETAAKNLINQIMIDFSGRHEDIAIFIGLSSALILQKSTPLNQPPFSTLPSSLILTKAI
jgi:hypothetical protein